MAGANIGLHDLDSMTKDNHKTAAKNTFLINQLGWQTEKKSKEAGRISSPGRIVMPMGPNPKSLDQNSLASNLIKSMGVNICIEAAMRTCISAKGAFIQWWSRAQALEDKMIRYRIQLLSYHGMPTKAHWTRRP